jgi:hypothetical protein
VKRGSLEKLQPELQRLQSLNQQIETQEKRLRVVQGEALQLGEWLEARSYWGTILNELREVLMAVEKQGKAKFNTDTGIWIERFVPDCASGNPNAPAMAADAQPVAPGAPTRRGRRGSTMPPQESAPGGCQTIQVIARAVDLSGIAGANANTDFAFMLNEALKTNAMFTTNSGILQVTPPDGNTFTVQMVVTPKRSLKL